MDEQSDGERRDYLPRGGENDGRGREEFSTGQCSQVAIAMMVAQNEMAQLSAFPPGHRVLILDDVSSSYDLESRLPVYFLTLKAGTQFTFRLLSLSAAEQRLEIAMGWLTHGLQWLGSPPKI